MIKQWFWFFLSIILNGIWFIIDELNPWSSNRDWYKNNFGLDDSFMYFEAWPKLKEKKSTHNIKKIAKDWLIIPESDDKKGKRAIRILSFLLLVSWIIIIF